MCASPTNVNILPHPPHPMKVGQTPPVYPTWCNHHLTEFRCSTLWPRSANLQLLVFPLTNHLSKQWFQGAAGNYLIFSSRSSLSLMTFGDGGGKHQHGSNSVFSLSTFNPQCWRIFSDTKLQRVLPLEYSPTKSFALTSYISSKYCFHHLGDCMSINIRKNHLFMAAETSPPSTGSRVYASAQHKPHCGHQRYFYRGHYITNNDSKLPDICIVWFPGYGYSNFMTPVLTLWKKVLLFLYPSILVIPFLWVLHQAFVW